MSTMKKVKSPSAIVFMMLALTACIAFIRKELDVSNFMTLAGVSFAFYFAKKPDSSNDSSQTTTNSPGDSLSS